MNLLILTQYFPPEVGAPQNRLFELAVRLRHLGVHISVLTAMPNYPQMKIHKAYVGKKYCYEEIQGLRIYRSSIYVSKNKSIVSRLRNYFSFVISSAITGTKRLGDFDFLLCESPPLFLGYSALYLAKSKNAKLIFNVSDLWPESAEKLGVVHNRWLLKMAFGLEEKLYKSSVLVTGQTQGICNNIKTRFPGVPTYWLPNGVDLNFYNPAIVSGNKWRSINGFLENDFILLYAGIIGIAQGLEIILKAAKHFNGHAHIKFVLLGSGPQKEMLVQQKEKESIDNVFFIDAVTKDAMPAILKSVNAAIIPLKKLDLFLGAIPSKIFETLAMEIPILLGVDGEARELFITEGKCGIYFEPGNVASLCETIEIISNEPNMALQLGQNGRLFVDNFFNRENIAAQFYERLQQI